MARFTIRGLDETLAQMRRLGEDTGATAARMLQAGAEQVKIAWQRAADEHGLRDTGDMINSIGYGNPTSSGGTLSVDIYPRGKDRKGVSNAQKAFILHYGSSRIDATRWVDDANRYAEETALAAMIEVWQSFLASR